MKTKRIMQVGDLIRKVDGEMDYGMTGVILEFSIPTAGPHRQEPLVLVLMSDRTRWWSTHEVEVINENR